MLVVGSAFALGAPGVTRRERGPKNLRQLARLTNLQDLRTNRHPFEDPLALDGAQRSWMPRDAETSTTNGLLLPASGRVRVVNLPWAETATLVSNVSTTAPTPPDAPAVPANKRPIAYMIAASARYTAERRKQLEDMGFEPQQVDPVYLETDCEGGNNTKKKAMWGIMNAHQNAWKLLSKSGRRGLVLESDWGIGNQSMDDLRRSMQAAAARDEHYLSVGWCRQMKHEVAAPWKFTCATAYFLSAEAATNLSKLRHADGEHAPCFPVDSLLVGACKDRSPRWKTWNINFDGRCCWWPGDATNQSVLNFQGYQSSQRGMLQQNRELYKSTHSAGGSEFDEENPDEADDPQEAESTVSSSSVAMFEREQRRAKEEQIGGEHTAWHRLNPPALCGITPWGTPGAADPAAAAGAIGLGFPPTATSLRQREERKAAEEREERRGERREERREERDAKDELGREEKKERREERREVRREEEEERAAKEERRERRRAASSERDRMRGFRHARRQLRQHKKNRK